MSWRGLVWGGLIFACVAAYAALPGETLLSRGVAAIPGVTAIVLLMLGLYQRWIGGARWLLTAAQDGLYINAGYCEGYPVAGEHDTALFIPREDILALCHVAEVLRLPYRFGVTRHHLGSLDVALNTAVSADVTALIARRHEQLDEAGKAGPFPLRLVSPSRLRLCWSAIRPGEKEAVTLLAHEYEIMPACHIVYPEHEHLNPLQQAIYLDELWRMGMRKEALFLARMYLGISLRAARTYMESRHDASATDADCPEI